ncbi:MAG: DUF2924 domain-containing protein [Planctomycetia bacterium]|nr:DUF2924 domain-containing protein [Planctomycetia bacterium]
MTLNVAKEVAAMERMTVKELQTKYADAFGEPTRTRNRVWLVKRIAWRLQALAEGDLSERARRRAAELANDADLRVTAPREPKRQPADGSRTVTRPASITGERLPLVGTVITRRYKGRTLHVKVRDDGFEFEGEVYKSLTAIVKAVTGTHWNGFHFFGLKKPGGGR